MNLQQIEKKLLDKTQYGGNKEPMVKAISASELGNDLLQIFLRFKYGVPDSTEFGQDTIGSLMHIALQDILKDEYEVEKKYQYQFNNGWFLTGSIDLINNEEIIDIKVTKQYTVEKILKEPMHSYRLQLNAYRYLVKKNTGEDLDTKLLLVLKDGGYDFRKMTIKPSLVLLDVEPIPDKVIEDKFLDITNKIEQYEELGEYPPQCSDLWWRKTKEGAIPVRCLQYCAYRNVCPYFKQNPKKINF
jgi:hypothetical protein